MTDLQTLWNTAFNEAIGEEQEKSSSNPVDWRTGGRATKAYPDKENGDWWNVKGLEMFETFTQWWGNSGWSVWHTPEGVPGLELEMNVNYGEIPVKAFVDMFAITADGELVVVDFKTGNYMPDSNMQLGLYACSMEKTFGVRPSHGYFYDARKGMLLPTKNLDRWTFELFTDMFKQFATGVENQIFLPNLGMNCRSCSVGDYCYVNGGELAHFADPLYAIANNKDG